jgi:hypothetical protein
LLYKTSQSFAEAFISHGKYTLFTLEERGLSPKIILGDSRQSENMQTQHIQACNTTNEVQVKVITYYVPCIRVYKRLNQILL